MSEPGTDEFFAEKMQELESLYDTEGVHKFADELLCEILTRVGFPKTVEAFRELDKWYA